MKIFEAAAFALTILLFVPTALNCAYLLAAALFAQRPPVPARSSGSARFDIIVPAHNEENGIARTVRSIQQLDWNSSLFRLLVIADNCTDRTAQVAAECGATVLVRNNPDLRGKGYALEFGFAHSLKDGWAQAVVIIDADSVVTSNILEAFAARIENGAEAIQSDYAVLNSRGAWRTRLIAIALGAFHIVRSRARERFGLSCGIRGNGWCVTHELLRKVPYHAFSLTEDVEFGLDIGLAGLRVHYADEAHTFGEMVTTADSAAKQRQRWEHGRLQLITNRVIGLLGSAIFRRNRIHLDLAADLLIPPLSTTAIAIFFLGVLTIILTSIDATNGIYLWAPLCCVASVCVYVFRGWQLSNVGWRGLADLLRAPGFIAWKMLVMLKPSRTKEWIRTDRERL
jgi:cellulose synthase/poly-beta-1,6-N-acetylglucosamine synthase-like glycosyltransferase